MNSCMIENLQRGVDSGIFREDININFVSRIYFTGLTGIKDSDIFPASMFEVHAVTKQFLEYHLRAIITPKGLGILEKFIK